VRGRTSRSIRSDPATGEIDSFPGVTIAACQLRPAIRGSIPLTSADATRQPALAFVIERPVGDYPDENDEASLLEEVASATLYLRTDESSYICGAELSVDGGMNAGQYVRRLPGAPKA